MVVPTPANGTPIDAVVAVTWPASCPSTPSGSFGGGATGAIGVVSGAGPTIGADGRVQHTSIVKSIVLLDQAAVDAVRQWEYAPSMLNGAAVAVVMLVVVNFTIQ